MVASPNFSNELESIRQKIDELICNQSMLDQRLKILSGQHKSDALLWRIQHEMNQLKEKQDSAEKQQETWQQTRQDEEKKLTQEINRRFDLLHQQNLSSTIDQQQIEQLIGTSTVIRNPHHNISNLQNLFATTPVSLTHAAIDAAIATSEQRLIERLTHDVGDKFHQLGAQIAELRALPTSITAIDVQNLIRDAMRTVKPTERSNSELETLGRTVNDRITQLEKRLNDFSQSIHSCVTRSTVDDLIRQAISNSQLTASQALATSQIDIGLQKRITSIEQRLDTFLPVEDLRQFKERLSQLENRAGDHTHSVSLTGVAPSPPSTESSTKSTGYVEDPRMILLQNKVDNHASFLQDLDSKINELKRTGIDLSGVVQLVNTSEAKTREAVNDLAKYVHRECEDARVSELINELSNYTTIINNLTNQINGLEHNKPDLKTVEKLIRDSEQRMVGTTTPRVSSDGQPDPRIAGLQTQINDHFGLIQSLEKQLEQFRQMKPDQQVVQKLINESERRTKTVIENLPQSMHQKGLDSRFSGVLKQINGHTVSIQDLNDHINQLRNIQSNAELRKRVSDNEHEVKKTQTELATLRHQFADQPTSASQPSLPQPQLTPPTNENSPAKQHTDEELQEIMPFVELLPTFNLFSENEWD